MKRWIAVLLTVVMCLSLCACGDIISPKKMSAPAQTCATLIDAIGNVSLDSKVAIETAEAAYEALTEEEKAELADEIAKLMTARNTYDSLVKEQESKERVDNVIELIDAIDATITVKSEPAITKAEDEYNKLSDEEKGKVTNYNKLEVAKTALGVALMAEQEKIKAEKEKVIKEYSKKFNIKTDKVEGITWYQPKNMPQYIDIRSYIIPYIGVRKNGTPWICVRYNYTDDDWVFWKSLKIVTDENTYNKSFSYFEIHRDNGGGDVWENYDEVFSVGTSMDSSGIRMLMDIATSDETIIRFQGDDYHYDLHVTKEDKNMIKDVLKLYEAMLP